MKDSCDHAPRSNPFSTRFVRPGAVPYLFAPGQSADGLVRRLAGFGWRGQIIGPHGSGKSTLLAALAEPLARAGRRSWTVCLHDGAIVKIRWCVRARVFLARARELSQDAPFQLGAVPHVELVTA